jgi:hypothetical protein
MLPHTSAMIPMAVVEPLAGIPFSKRAAFTPSMIRPVPIAPMPMVRGSSMITIPHQMNNMPFPMVAKLWFKVFVFSIFSPKKVNMDFYLHPYRREFDEKRYTFFFYPLSSPSYSPIENHITHPHNR